MGRQNRTRRKKKQQKKRKQSGGSRSQNKAFNRFQEAEALCGPVAAAIEFWELPPPSLVKDLTQLPLSPEGEKLKTLLFGFMNYLFQEHPATGDKKTLKVFKQEIQQTEVDWLYPVLFIYCLISSEDLTSDNLDRWKENLYIEQLEEEFLLSDALAIEIFLAPMYLFFWLMGRPLANQPTIERCVKNWLSPSPLHRLVSPLTEFLKLKQPKVEQKTVKNLEKSLEQVDFHSHDQWRNALSRTLTLFLHNRLNARQWNPDTWKDLPQLSALIGLTEVKHTTGWSQISISKADNTTLNKLTYSITMDTMGYIERLQLEALKCRILASQLSFNQADLLDFEVQLKQLINLLCTGIPPDQKQVAEHCLDATCQWLADEMGRGKISSLDFDLLRKMYRRRKDDYRLMIMIYLSTNNGANFIRQQDRPGFQNIHDGIFFRGLQNAPQTNDFLETFYWPLSSELRKSLFIHSCRRIFLGSMGTTHITHYWQLCRNHLVNPEQDPFIDIVNGNPCESELLFYGALAIIDNQSQDIRVHNDHVTLVLHFGADLLTRYNSEFNQQQLIQLIEALMNKKYGDLVFDIWGAAQAVIEKAQTANEFEGLPAPVTYPIQSTSRSVIRSI